MRNNLPKRVMALLFVVVLVAEIFLTPFKAFAFNEEAINLNINTSSIEVKNAWKQINNAAVVHLIAQKMQTCIEIGQVVLNKTDTGGIMGTLFGGTVWPSKTKEIPILGIDYIDGVLDKGNVFKGGAGISGDPNTAISVGPWMSNLFKGQDDGIIHCNNRTGNDRGFFDMFVYVVKNYKAGMTLSDLENASVSQADRLSVVCNKYDQSKPGLLTPSDSNGEPTMQACNGSDVDWYTGVSIPEQEAYIKQLYEEMRSNSGNEYIVSWDNLGFYDKVDGYVLYNKDFSSQCGGVSSGFTTTKGSDGNYEYVDGYQIDSDGLVTKGYYPIKNKGDKARGSFVAAQLTCKQLVERMNNSITPYLQKVNFEVYNACKEGVVKEIGNKKNEITTKYLNSDSASDEEKTDANSVIAEYDRIISEKEFVATKEGDTETLRNTSNGVPSNEAKTSMPTEYVWTCRAHLPFIDVAVQEEADLSEAIEDEFYDACYDTVDLAWVICPIINGLSNIVDSLNALIEDFF